MPTYIHERKGWPTLKWDNHKIAAPLANGARATAAALLARFGCLRRVLTADLAVLSAFVDIRVGIDLQLIYDAARRLAAAELPGRCVVSSWTALIDYLKLTMAHCEREAFRVPFLDHTRAIRETPKSRGSFAFSA